MSLVLPISQVSSLSSEHQCHQCQLCYLYHQCHQSHWLPVSPVSTVLSISPVSPESLATCVTSANCVIYVTSHWLPVCHQCQMCYLYHLCHQCYLSHRLSSVSMTSSVSIVSLMSAHRPTLSVVTRDMTVSCRHGSDSRLSTVIWFVWTNYVNHHMLCLWGHPLPANTVQCQCYESCLAQSEDQTNISCQHVTLPCVLVK